MPKKHGSRRGKRSSQKDNYPSSWFMLVRPCALSAKFLLQLTILAAPVAGTVCLTLAVDDLAGGFSDLQLGSCSCAMNVCMGHASTKSQLAGTGRHKSPGCLSGPMDASVSSAAGRPGTCGPTSQIAVPLVFCNLVIVWFPVLNRAMDFQSPGWVKTARPVRLVTVVEHF